MQKKYLLEILSLQDSYGCGEYQSHHTLKFSLQKKIYRLASNELSKIYCFIAINFYLWKIKNWCTKNKLGLPRSSAINYLFT